MRYWVVRAAIGLAVVSLCGAQTLQPRRATAPTPAPVVAPQIQMIALAVPAGTPLKVALQKDIRITKVGQPVRARVVAPVFAFDRLVVPEGSEVSGKVAAIAPVSRKKRALAALNADLSPKHAVRIEFDELQLPNGRTLPISTDVTGDAGGVLELVTAAPPSGSKAKNLVARQVSEARKQIRSEWAMARNEIVQPGKFHRLERYAFTQLPYRPQYLDAGTTYDADLRVPLDFGSEPLRPGEVSDIATSPKAGSLLHAELATALSSATSKKGDRVEAVITQPLFEGDHLILPAGSRLQGTVLQVRPARRLHRNGLLRIAFHRIVLPGGVAEKVTASLEAVAVAKGHHLALDSEGGAQVTTPKTSYLGTAMTVALAGASMSDHDAATDHGSDPGRGAVGGGLGLRSIGLIAGTVAHSRAFSSGMGFYGAGMSVYQRFLTRGSDVVYPKDMSLVIGLGTRTAASAPSATH